MNTISKLLYLILLLAISTSMVNAGWSKQQYYDNRIKDYTKAHNELVKHGTKGFVASCKAKIIKSLTKSEAKTLLVIREWGKLNGKYTCEVVWVDANVNTNGGFVKKKIVMDCIDTTVKVIQGEPGAAMYQSYDKNVKTCK